MTANDLIAKHTGPRNIKAKAACGHILIAGAGRNFGEETKARAELAAKAQMVICTACETQGATPIIATPPTPATAKQIAFARSLINRHLGEYTAKGQNISLDLLRGISKAECSSLIDDIRTLS